MGAGKFEVRLSDNSGWSRLVHTCDISLKVFFNENECYEFEKTTCDNVFKHKKKVIPSSKKNSKNK